MRQLWGEFDDYGASESLSLSFDAITSHLKNLNDKQHEKDLPLVTHWVVSGGSASRKDCWIARKPPFPLRNRAAPKAGARQPLDHHTESLGGPKEAKGCRRCLLGLQTS